MDAAPVLPSGVPQLLHAAGSAAPAAPRQSIDPERIHPELWRGHQLGRAPVSTVPTGVTILDRQLPGGGWPKRVLTELLLKHPGVGEMRLLAPALAATARGEQGPARSVMLFDPPATPCAWAMAQLGLQAQALIVVHGREGPRGAAVRHLLGAADVLWALEQALRSGHAGAILAWLPERLRADALRRLQLAAQAHDGLIFLFRGIEERLKPSPAPLRLALHPAGADALAVQLLKRRGPALLQPLYVRLPPVASPRRQAPVSEEGQAVGSEVLVDAAWRHTTATGGRGA
jgi:protein ImuA